MKKIRNIFRHLINRRLTTLFVLISFTMAFSCCILVYLFVADELSFDKYNTNFAHTYRLNLQSKDKSYKNCLFPAVFTEKFTKIPGIEKYTRFQTYMGERFISIDNTTYTATSFLFADPEILDILQFEFLLGNPREALAKPLNVIINLSTAQKYFGSANPIGKIIKQDNQDFTVSAVVKDLPGQSHFTMNFLASVASYQISNNDMLTKWYMSAFNYYLLIPDAVNRKEIETQLANLFAEGNGIDKNKMEFEMYLEPLADIHLKSVGTRWDNALKGDIQVVYGLGMIALLILGIAIANYINVLTADCRRKAKETSIQRVNGASGYTIIADQVLETSVFLLSAFLLSMVLTSLMLPVVNNLSGKSLSINWSVLMPGLAVLATSIILSSIYPIVFLNSIKPAEALKNQLSIIKVKSQQKQQWLRGALVTFQLVIATMLIASTIVINNQLQLVMNAKTGFDKENTLIVYNPYTEGMNERYDLFRQKLSNLPMIQSVGVAQNAPGNSINNVSPAWLPNQNDQKADIGQITVDHDFLKTVGAKFAAGRNFDINVASDKATGMIINQSAVKALNLNDPIGKKIVVQNNVDTPNNELEVIGVIEDMQYFTLREASKPVMYYIKDWGKYEIAMKLVSGDYLATLKQIESIWKEIAPQWPFSYQFMDERISINYKSEINTAKIITGLSGISIFLSVLGILGMILFTIQQRTKEIGIRKVNGARVSEVVTMLNKDFVKWVAIAFVIATPIAYYAMNKWLENFAYKTELSWWIFALAGLLALGIALSTVSWQSWRAATKNPVEALRYE
ncbi:MAG: ABC transporter permease [Bacteroidota bacterium]|nr:ABC transporter permease [Bacteroidota bacterium]